ncbi:Glu/Leu/Phe/Val dehydrogenase [Alkalicella caledoniensis]|uniref:Glu/Leu/Phe/Val dehydrogenase n=1 Tax=Alkalicella caledoniensis TaxID=2731377 RepID=A0A7G9WBW7_ALKCA|nr:Glu/Leu/Phe/Val dehydrogenase [Alkalicella caledoniensis]QNO16179.1 Glu/Leu/Phe/Val dehydrogenase [Alkalicella caledoniensis]
MEIFKYMEKYDYEQLVICHDKTSGLKAIIGIHDTTLGPALGGTRMWNYATEEEAIEDALRLSKGMTYKAAAAGLNLGGGKTVIWGDSKTQKSEELFRAFGRYVQSLNGRYITAADVGTVVDDMDNIRLETNHVVGISSSQGGSGDPSPKTAWGVFRGIQASANEAWGSDDLTGKVVAVQGTGKVGYYVCKYLHEAGAKLIVTDIDQASIDRVVNEFGAQVVALDEIYGVECDIYSPNALGATINDDTIPQFKCKVIAGGANNQLKEERHGDIIHEKGFIYAPDYVINAGGLINVADELKGYNEERAMQSVSKIYDNIKRVYAIAKRDGIPIYKAADRMAEERIEKIGSVHRTYLNK